MSISGQWLLYEYQILVLDINLIGILVMIFLFGFMFLDFNREFQSFRFKRGYIVFYDVFYNFLLNLFLKYSIKNFIV